MKLLHIISLFLIANAGCQSIGTGVVLGLHNPGFEEPVIGPGIPGWETSQHGGPTEGKAYEMAIDSNSPAAGSQSLRVTRLLHEDYGLVHQRLTISPDLAGKSVTFSAKLRSKDVGPEGWLLVVNMHSSATLLKPATILKQARSRVITGTTDWQWVALSTDIPPGTTSLDIGFLLLDAGTGWADEALVTRSR